MTLDGAPIFIVGVTQRCGTHFLYDLLLRHPDCRGARDQATWDGSWEDHLLEHADLLLGYAERVRASDHRNDAGTSALLLHAFGEAWQRFLGQLGGHADDRRRVVTKTPLAEHLVSFRDLCPDPPLLLLVRDPRACLASALHTFGGSPDDWIRRWKAGARDMVTVAGEQHPSTLLLRYEDLFADTETTLRAVFDTCALDPAAYDFDGVATMPVRGSSELGGPPRRVGWTPVVRSATFDPLRRADRLPASLRSRVEWLAGEEMAKLGYLDAPADLSAAARAAQHGRDIVDRCRRQVLFYRHLVQAGRAAQRRRQLP